MINIKIIFFLVLVAVKSSLGVRPNCFDDCSKVEVKCVSAAALGCPHNFKISTCTCCPICLKNYGVKPLCLDCENVKVRCVSAEDLGCPHDFEVSKCTCCPQCRKQNGY